MHKITLSKISQLMVFAAYVALITLSPSLKLITYIEFHDCQRILQLLLLCIVLIDGVLIGFKLDYMPHINNKVRLGIIAIIVLALISSYMSLAPRYAYIETSIFAALCYLALFVARSLHENKDNFIKYLTYALWASVVLYMVSFYVGYTTAIALKKTLQWPAPFFGFSNIRLFQQYQLWALGLICLPLLAFELKQKIRIWLYFGLACWWVLLFYAASRGVTLGWLLAMMVTTIVYKKIAVPLLRIQLISAAGGLAGYLVLFKAIPYWIASSVVSGATNAGSAIITSTIFRDTTYDRLDLWKVAYVMIKNFPFFGVGPMNFYFYNSFGTHPHNSVLQIAAEWGLPATFIILAILGYSFNCWYKKFNATKLQTASKLDSNLSIILFFTIIANGAYSLVEGVIVMPISQVLMFTMIGLMIGQYTDGDWLVTSEQQIKRKFKFRPNFAGIVLVAMVLSTMPELVRGLTSYQRYYQPGERAFSMSPGTINPRIWMQQRRVEPDANKPESNQQAN